MGGGSGAARAVSAVVLIDGSFAGVPAVLAEGRRVIGNVERLASLFFTKTVYAFLLALSVSVAVVPFPFLPSLYSKSRNALDLIVAIFDDSLQGFGSRLASARAFQLTHSLF